MELLKICKITEKDSVFLIGPGAGSDNLTKEKTSLILKKIKNVLVDADSLTCFKKNPKDYIELAPLKVWYQFIFEDKSKFNYSGNEIEMKKQIESINKNEYDIHFKASLQNRQMDKMKYEWWKDEPSGPDDEFDY